MKIHVERVTKEFDSIIALDDVSLQIEPSQIVALIGTNGAGKTTLMRCLAGIIRPAHGEISYDGERFMRERIDLRRRLLFIPDTPFVIGTMHPIRHIAMTLRLFDADKRAGIEENVMAILRELELIEVAQRPIGTLSKGEIYKTALAALYATDPEVWILDEPFASGMDPNGLTSLKKRVRDAAARGRTIVYSTQILDLAESFADRVCILHRGQLRGFDTVANLREQSADNNKPLEEIFSRLKEEKV